MATALFAGAFAALVTWWSKTPNALNADQFATYHFGTQGFAPVAYSVFAVSLGTMFGAWFKRIMPALGLTLAISIPLLVIIVPNFIRPHYMTPIAATHVVELSPNNAPTGSWQLGSGLKNKAGVVTSGDPSSWPSQCQASVVQGPGGRKSLFGAGQSAATKCLNDDGYRQITIYQPASRYWDFQWIESGLYLGMAALAVCATYWLVLKRDA